MTSPLTILREKVEKKIKERTEWNWSEWGKPDPLTIEFVEEILADLQDVERLSKYGD